MSKAILPPIGDHTIVLWRLEELARQFAEAWAPWSVTPQLLPDVATMEAAAALCEYLGVAQPQAADVESSGPTMADIIQRDEIQAAIGEAGRLMRQALAILEDA